MTDGYYRCDRCGEFERGPIKRNKRSFAGTDFGNEAHRRITYGHLTGKDETGAKSRTVELCHECRKDLTEWVNDD